MGSLSQHINELRAAEAFNRQAPVFDALYETDPIIQYKRHRVREHMLWLLPPSADVLELNCGSGTDAIYFAGEGHRVHATDISAGMLRVLEEKISTSMLKTRISMERCSFTELPLLENKGPFDHIYSNFGGLNCTGEIHEVLQALPSLLKPGGTVTLVIISRFCLWETMMLFRGKFKTAFRRFFSGAGRKAMVEGHSFRCWYYAPQQVQKLMQKDFELLSLEGLCTLVPPSYMEGFAQKYPRLFHFLLARENKWKGRWPWKAMGDYYIISFRKKIS